MAGSSSVVGGRSRMPRTFEFEYCMDNYAVNLEKMKDVGGEGDLTPKEKTQMASIIGQLNWMARQGRFDLCYGVSHVQQLMARGDRTAIEWLNKIIYRAKQKTVQKISVLKVTGMIWWWFQQAVQLSELNLEATARVVW